MKKILLSILCVFAMLPVCATITGSVTLQPTKAQKGTVTEVEVYYTSDVALAGIKFSVTLPDGVSTEMTTSDGETYPKVTCEKAATVGTVLDGKRLGVGFIAATAIFDAASEPTLLGKLYLKSDTPDTYQLALSGISMVDGNNNENDIEGVNNYAFSVQRAAVIEKFGDICAIEIDPFSISKGISYDNAVSIPINMKNVELKIKTVNFDFELPAGIEPANYYDSDEQAYIYTEPEFSNKQGSPSGEISKNDDGTYHFAMTGGNTKYIKAASSLTQFATIPLMTSSNLTDGLYTLKITNAEITPTTVSTTYEGEYYASITVGTPTDPNPIVYGDITEASQVTAAVPTDATSVDLSQTTASNDVVDAIVTDAQTKNANAIVYAPSTYVGTKDNVVVSDEDGNLSCSSFKMTDGNTMNIPASFTATQASYSRTFETNQNWGTICLPYAVKSDATVAYYKISAINAGVLSIEKYDELPANTPALVKKLSGDAIAASAEGVSVGGALGDVTGDVVMKGSYTKDTKVTDANAYYIKDNKFYSCKNYFYIDAFRAYFTVSSGAKQSVFEIGDDTVTALNALVGDSSDVKIEAVYDASGALRNEVGNGLNIVRLSNGKTQKIMVK